jgi:hypothetical protein
MPVVEPAMAEPCSTISVGNTPTFRNFTRATFELSASMMPVAAPPSFR